MCMNSAFFRRSLLLLRKKPSGSQKKPSDLQKPSGLRWRRAANAFRKGVSNRGINFKDVYRSYSQLLLIQKILWATALFWQNLCMYPLIYVCILWATVYPVSYCVLIGRSHKLPPTSYTGSLWTRLEYKLVDANRVCLGIHKFRVGPMKYMCNYLIYKRLHNRGRFSLNIVQVACANWESYYLQL